MIESFMQAVHLPARAGISWLLEGYRLFRRQPLPMLSWALLIGLFLMIVNLLPILGGLIFLICMPALTVMTMQASADITSGRSFAPFELLSRFWRSPHSKAVIKLGGLYAGLMIIIVGLSVIPFIDRLTVLSNLKTFDGAALQSLLTGPVLVFALLYLPFACAFWYAPALMAWHGLSISQSLFFSLVACWRNKWAFLLYGATVILLLLGIDRLADIIFSALGLPAPVEVFIRTPLNFLMTAIIYSSFFPSYVQVFHRLAPNERRKPESPPASSVQD